MDQVFDDDTVKPLPGYVVCEKYTGIDKSYVEGFGTVDVTQKTASGLLIVSEVSQESEFVTANRVVVRRVGESPYAWKFRCLTTRGAWQGENPGKLIDRDFKTTFEEQKVEPGVVLATRASYGAEQDKTSRFIVLRYDEICAIGKPFDEPEGFEMRPAPGWVLVKKDIPERTDALEIPRMTNQLIEQGGGTWGYVLEVPRGCDSEGLKPGDRILFPSYATTGSTEYIEFEGGIRCLPLEDVLAIQTA
jgi:hypothetical protein